MKLPRPAWISATLSLVSLAVVTATATVLLSRPADGWPAYSEQDPSPTTGMQPGKYTLAKVGNTCDLLDLTAVENLGQAGHREGPSHHEIKDGTGGILNCQQINDHSSISLSVYLDTGGDDLFESRRQDLGAATGSGYSFGTAPEFGADTFYSAQVTTGIGSGTPTGSVRANLGVLDANLFVSIHIDAIRSTGPLPADEVLQLAKTQMKRILETLHT